MSELAASDIDGDEVDEIFYSLGGNTGLTGVILEFQTGRTIPKSGVAKP